MRITPVDALTARRLGLPLPLERVALEAAQLAALRQTLRHAREKSPWYRKHLAADMVNPRSLSDLAALPFLSGEDLAAHGSALLCVSQSEVARIMTLHTSGSTGAPKRVFFTKRDLGATLDFFQNGMKSLISAQDKVLVLLPFDLPDSTGDLLLRALQNDGVSSAGYWPPDAGAAQFAVKGEFSCVVGLPQHLLALAYDLPPELLRTMLLCSDYAPPVLRQNIEKLCGCETFLHYGSTETGLGGAVECTAHAGCHIRESDLLVEIVDPQSGRVLPDGEEGEVVVTTLGREAMPLIRYRTGDLARLDRSGCLCSGITSRLYGILGRKNSVHLSDGSLDSQTLDDALFAQDQVLDYRATLHGPEDALEIEVLARSDFSQAELLSALAGIPVLARMVERQAVHITPVSAFSPSHTTKRVIADQRGRKA